MTGPTPPGLLDGHELLAAFLAASKHLRELAPTIDAINVYPVPDGDTGANMSATLREAVDRATMLDGSPTVAEVLESIARGGLYGARGNSGVIFSQALRGFANGVGEVERLDAQSLARGLSRAAEAAYSAVTRPQEGTMLTVMRIAGEAAARHTASLAGGGAGQACLATLRTAIAAAEEAEDATMDQLPALREAGVPDAGGEGVCVFFRGLEAAIAGTAPRVHAIPQQPIAMLEGHEHEALGFCTEFLIEPRTGETLEVDTLRAMASAGGNRAVVVVGDELAARIHAHSDDPDSLVAAAEAKGHISRLKVEDMDVQNLRFRQTGSGAARRIAVLALSHGEGFDAVFRSLGAEVMDLGEVVKPPAGQIAAAADALTIPDVIVLANHKNVVMAARLAASMARCTLHVVATESLPQGVAALLAFDADERAVDNVAAMSESALGVRTVEVTIAAASRTIDGIAVATGQAIALVEGRLVAARANDAEALVEGLRIAGAEAGGLVTLYSGEGVSREALAAAQSAVETAFPNTDLEALAGGQPLYPFIASLEP